MAVASDMMYSSLKLKTSDDLEIVASIGDTGLISEKPDDFFDKESH